MDDAQFAELVGWIADQGLAGEEEPELVSGFCTRAVAFGLPLTRAAVLIDTLHPLYEGHFFGWQADGKITLREYGSSREGEAQERWLRSPFYRLVESGEPLLRRRINAESRAEFPSIAELAPDATEFVAMVHRFKARASSARWTVSTRPGRRIARRGLATVVSPTSNGLCRCWRWR